MPRQARLRRRAALSGLGELVELARSTQAASSKQPMADVAATIGTPSWGRPTSHECREARSANRARAGLTATSRRTPSLSPRQGLVDELLRLAEPPFPRCKPQRAQVVGLFAAPPVPLAVAVRPTLRWRYECSAQVGPLLDARHLDGRGRGVRRGRRAVIGPDRSRRLVARGKNQSSPTSVTPISRFSVRSRVGQPDILGTCRCSRRQHLLSTRCPG